MRSGAFRYGGIGFHIYWLDGVYVHTVNAGDPAARAGLKRRDRIVAIDGASPPSLDGAANAIRGTPGTPVKLTVKSPAQAPRDVTIVRAEVQGRERPEARRLDARIGYVFVPTFGTSDMGALAYDALTGIVTPDLAGLVLDLRGNAGGGDAPVRELLGAFVSGDVLTLVGDHHPAVALTVPERPLYAALARVPLVVLVDRTTASFGETVAAILQSLRGARVVGEPTAGNSETTTRFTFADGSVLWLAVATDRLPNGTVVDRVTPDIAVSERWIDYAEDADPYVLKAMAALKEMTR
jgi:C-terminal peptidase prc